MQDAPYGSNPGLGCGAGPLPVQRLSTQDQEVALAYALATQALHTVLAGITRVDPETQRALGQVCHKIRPGDGPPSTLDQDREPLAAMTVLMAASLAAFGEAAHQLHTPEASLESVRPAAQAILSKPPVTNLAGVCATWGMVKSALSAGDEPVPQRRHAKGQK